MSIKTMWSLLFGERPLKDIEIALKNKSFVKKSELIRYYSARESILFDTYDKLHKDYQSLKYNIQYDMIRDHYKRNKI